MTRAMILAAGFGSRLGTLSDELPKPLLPVADVPLIRYSLALLVGHGIRDVVINLHHLGQEIERELGDGGAFGVRITYSRETRILGTGGGIRRALPLLGSETFLVMNGKIVHDLDLDEVIAHHRASSALATLVVRPDADARRWGAIDAPAEGGLVRGLLGGGQFMFTGVHVIEPALVAMLPDDDQKRCIVREGYVPWLGRGARIGAYVSHGYFMEHSTPERYLAGNIKVVGGEAKLRYPPGPVAGIDPSARVSPNAKLVPPLRIGAGAEISEGTTVGPNTVIGSGAAVAPGVAVTDSVVWANARVSCDAYRSIVTCKQRIQAK